MKLGKYILFFLVIHLLTSCQNGEKKSDAIIDSVQQIKSHENNNLSLYYEIKNKVTSEIIGSHEVSINQGNDNFLYIDEKRYLKKEFLKGLGRDLTNTKNFKLNSSFSLVSLTETEYLNDKARFEKNVEIKFEKDAQIINSKSVEYTQDNQEKTYNEQSVFPSNQIINAGSYFQIPFLITNLKDKHFFYYTIDGKVNSLTNLGNEKLKTSNMGVIETTKLSTKDETVTIWIESENKIIYKIEEYITEDNIIETILTKQEDYNK